MITPRDEERLDIYEGLSDEFKRHLLKSMAPKRFHRLCKRYYQKVYPASSNKDIRGVSRRLKAISQSTFDHIFIKVLVNNSTLTADEILLALCQKNLKDNLISVSEQRAPSDCLSDEMDIRIQLAESLVLLACDRGHMDDFVKRELCRLIGKDKPSVEVELEQFQLAGELAWSHLTKHLLSRHYGVASFVELNDKILMRDVDFLKKLKQAGATFILLRSIPTIKNCSLLVNLFSVKLNEIFSQQPYMGPTDVDCESLVPFFGIRDNDQHIYYEDRKKLVISMLKTFMSQEFISITHGPHFFRKDILTFLRKEIVNDKIIELILSLATSSFYYENGEGILFESKRLQAHYLLSQIRAVVENKPYYLSTSHLEGWNSPEFVQLVNAKASTKDMILKALFKECFSKQIKAQQYPYWIRSELF